MSAIFEAKGGIPHLEDLDVQEFIDVLEKLPTLKATEKLDGANLWIGLDNKGRLFASREGKRAAGKRFLSPDAWPKITAYNGFRAAHGALEKLEPKIKKVLNDGDMVEVEILFGRQPNVVTYGAGGKNFIVLLRPVEGTSEESFQKLEQILDGSEAISTQDLLDTTDGKDLKETPTSTEWKVTSVKEVDSSSFGKVDVKNQLAELKKFLQQANQAARNAGVNLTNFDTLKVNLNKIDKAAREAIKAAREATEQEVLSKFKIPIKDALLKEVVRKLRSTLSASDVKPEEDTGVEGVVLRDKDSGRQIKIVDKDEFLSINDFNWQVRSRLNGSVVSLDKDAALEDNGGLFGQAKIRIADLLGSRELALASQTKKILSGFKGKDWHETAAKYGENLKSLSLEGAKKKISAILEFTLEQVEKERVAFREKKDSYELKLANGKTIKLSDSVVKRTLLAFAELAVELKRLISKIKSADSMAQVVEAIYERQLKDLHPVEEVVNEGAKKFKYGSRIDPANIDELETDEIIDAYTATLLASMLIFRVGDEKGINFLKDPAHASLKRYSPSMSPLNFWGLVVFNPTASPQISRRIYKEVADELKEVTGRILPSRVNDLHRSLSSGDMVQDHAELSESARILTLRFENRSPAINTVRAGLELWEDAPLSTKSSVVNKLYYLLNEFVPGSPLIGRIREISTKLLMNANRETQPLPLLQTVNNQLQLIEDNGGGNGGGGNGGGNGGFGNGAEASLADPTEYIEVGGGAGPTPGTAAPTPVRIVKGKVVTKRPRRFEKLFKFSREQKVKRNEE